MGQYKKGDWVRVVHTDYPSEIAVGECRKVVSTSDDGVDLGWPEGFGDDGSLFFFDHEVEPWQPKVGERVRCIQGTSIVEEGKIYPVVMGRYAPAGNNTFFVDTGEHGALDYNADYFEPINDTLPVAEQPAALKIKAGRFYKTRDGRKVGPMREADHTFWDYKVKWTFGKEGWYAAGNYYTDHPHENDLIAEWVDAPVDTPSAPTANLAATVDAINDEYGPVVREVPVLVAGQPARLKVGDEVVSTEVGPTSGLHGVIVADDRSNTPFLVRFDGWREGHGERDDEWWVGEEDLVLADYTTPIKPITTTAIVALIENGQPLPATRPAVHLSAEAADAEARRLASIHKGQEFGVFTLGATHKEARVYEHEWQRLAAEGEKIQAIKSLREAAGTDLKSAKDAVEFFATHRAA